MSRIQDFPHHLEALNLEASKMQVELALFVCEVVKRSYHVIFSPSGPDLALLARLLHEHQQHLLPQYTEKRKKKQHRMGRPMCCGSILCFCTKPAYQIQLGQDEVEGVVAPDPFDLAPLAEHLDLEACD